MPTSLKPLKEKRSRIKSQLTRFKTYIDNITENDSVIEISTRLDKAYELWDKYDEIQASIEELHDGNPCENERESFEATYFGTVSAARQLVAVRGRSAEQTSNVQTVAPIKLPTINLPTFSGAYDEWLQYFDSFNSLIHTNASLAPIQRFHYLKSTLTGDAAQLIKSLEVSSANYEIAWKLLQERFENKKVIVNNHVRALFEINHITKESHIAIRQLVDNTQKHLRALHALKQPTEHWDTLVIYIVSSKLDQATRREWETSIQGNELPTIQQLMAFLGNRAQILESVTNTQVFVKPQQTKINYNNIKHKTNNSEVSYATFRPDCPVCLKSHPIYGCQEFLKLSISDRYDKVKQLKLCTNCLRAGHTNVNCFSSNCRTCNKKHNSLLHVQENTTNQIHETVIATHCLEQQKTQILLSTAVIQIFDKFGKIHECRVLLDSGSQSNFITYELSKKLQLACTNINIAVKGIQTLTTNLKHRTEIKIKSKYNSFHCTIPCLVIPKITDQLPVNKIKTSRFSIPDHITLADPTFNIPGSIDMILGSSIFWDLLCIGQIKAGKNQPVLQKTKLGWIIAGAMITTNNNSADHNSLCHLSTSTTLEETLSKFWEIEEIPNGKIYTDEEAMCEELFERTLIINQEGRYEVSLPLRNNNINLGESRETAYNRFKSIEKKLANQPELKTQYREFMEEYERLGHMTQVKAEASTETTYYMPHHAVIKPASETTKLRVVFDASAKTTSGLSLNDTMMTGPIIQDDLFSIAMRFRTHTYVITGDITKMYRQVVVTPENRKLQRILWREEEDQPIRCYEMNTVTYGTAAGPFLAIRALHEVAHENQNKYPQTCNIIKRDFYVDDLMTGCHSIEEGKIIIHELSKILKTRGFIMAKWNSNERELLQEVVDSDVHRVQLHITDGTENKTLGLIWDSNTDNIKYSSKFKSTGERVSKRSILSTIAQIFDPLGCIGPIIIKTKIILQKLWQLKVEWDEAIPMELYTMWMEFQDQLQMIENIRIPRHVMCANPIQLQLHGYSDASESAYGACIYIRSTDQYGNHTANLLCAKSRVAPLKSITLPRLELCGALLLAKLSNKVINSLNIKFDKIFHWCDSTITLCWIMGEPCSWKTFVANRVTEIQNLTSNSKWQHINTHDNPADQISRGLTPQQLQDSRLWWKGPIWLTQDELYWPKPLPINRSDQPERKKQSICNLTCVIKFELDIFERFSSLLKLQRTIAYCLRFKENSTKPRAERQIGALTVSELSNSLICLIKIAQAQMFNEEIRRLNNDKSLKHDSKLLSLNPFIDDNGLIRVGGRLKHANINYNQKHPIVLGKNHRLTELIITNEHIKLLHAGCQSVLCSVRKQYWPMSGRSTTKKIIRKCVRCFKTRPSNSQYIMGNLPAARVTPTRPFYVCGVDYAGPVFIKQGNYRSKTIIKTYFCIFICFSTKAVHIELAHDLSSNAFLNCLRRFISRRGLCKDIYSDNGTNFVGAQRELAEIHHLLQNQEKPDNIANYLSTNNIQWHFIPPRSPNFGGLWEAAVKSVKYHVSRIAGRANLTYEEMNTLLVQVESCLNSRPISPLSNDPTDPEPLTPGHFLIGDSLKALPQRNFDDQNMLRLTRYQRLQAMFKQFWNRWHHDYLHQLQQRNKWKQNQSSANKLQLGKLVIIREDNVPALHWPLGRITQLHPGSDGVTRVVSVKVNNSEIKRPVSKVCVVPTDD